MKVRTFLPLLITGEGCQPGVAVSAIARRTPPSRAVWQCRFRTFAALPIGSVRKTKD